MNECGDVDGEHRCCLPLDHQDAHMDVSEDGLTVHYWIS